MNSTTQKYTVGIIFNNDYTKVLLVHKQRPEWQKGKVNFVGGKYEAGETAQECITRETEEETTLAIPPTQWTYIGTIHQSQGNVGILATQYNGNLADAAKNDHEEIEWCDVNDLPHNAIRNLTWLIPLALEKLTYATPYTTFSVEYT